MTTVITFGTFDVFHYGHLRILERASRLGERLAVGVSSDQFSLSKKGRLPVFPQEQRMAIIGALRFVDAVFLEEAFELKREYIREQRANILVMGSDWQGRFDDFNDLCEVRYLERTPAVSTTVVIETIRTRPHNGD
jgi:glycerol-3-phosphate cytidylyltransferase